ncbi:unnamed protein product [Rhizoctonia solani]|uniref:Xylanolytic transcriptional activator regulatory domain-containing protein n=1 Tax=Rhizoctonia solani TaxID=456999 RepID=A0A8H3HXE0_9AGAM|nr:unnamed protein product [Rhizoctonia solani]
MFFSKPITYKLPHICLSWLLSTSPPIIVLRWNQHHLRGFACLLGLKHASYAADANYGVMQLNPSAIDVAPQATNVNTKTQLSEDQIKEIEAKINEIEQRRGRSSVTSRASSSSSQNESNSSSGTLFPRSLPQVASPIAPLDDLAHQASEFSLYLGSDNSFQPNMLSQLGPSDLSLPGETSRKLLNMFLQRKQISGFGLHVGRVVKSFQPGSADHGVPALYFAMLLLGCHFISEPELKLWEEMLYQRTKLEIEGNVARAYLNDRSKYNPLHHLQAMVMLGQWFYLKNRLLEGHVFMSRAMQFAIALGLHELDSRIYGHYIVMNQRPPRRGIERWSPRDPVELGEAINLWWACLVRDFVGVVLNGLPPSISPEEIKTVWPVSLSDFEDMGGSELSNDNRSVASLFDPEYYHIVTSVSQDTANCIVAKASTLTYCAGKLDTERMSSSEVTDDWWARFEECDRALESFARYVRNAYTGRDIEDIVNIALSQTAVDCSIIQLHGPLADYELNIGAQGDTRGLLADNSLGGNSYVRCIEACRSIALATAYVEGIDASYMQMFFGISWSCAARVLAKQIPRLRQSSYAEQAQEMERQLAVMVKNIEKLLVIYPVLGTKRALCVGKASRNVTQPSLNVEGVLLPAQDVNTKTSGIGQEPKYSRIRELEDQIQGFEQRSGQSPLQTMGAIHHHGLSPGLSSGSSCSPLSHSPTTPPVASSSVNVQMVLPYRDPWLQPVPSPPPPKPQSIANHGSTRASLEKLEPSADVIKRLILPCVPRMEIFIQRHIQCCFELDLNRVVGILEPGARAAKHIIPALYNAMLLVACHFTQDPELKVWEDLLLERTKREIESRIIEAHGGRVHNYNSLHHLVAMSLFGLYYYFKGRLLEGHVHTGQATRFAMSLGLHKIRSRIFQRRPAPTAATARVLVEPWWPEDQRELAEAINVWWKCCGIDMGGSALNGLPASISPEEITTVWPRLLSEYGSGQTIPDDEYSVESLFDPQLYYTVTDSSQDNVKCLLAKACILMISSARLGMERSLGSRLSDEWWMQFEQVDRSVNRFMETMPPVYLGRNEAELSYLIIAHSGIYCAQVQLHSTLAEHEFAQVVQDSHQENDFLGGVSYTRCTEACRAAALAAALVSHMDMSNMLLFIGIAWVSVSEVLIRYIPRLRRRGNIAQTREKEHQLAIIEKCMERATPIYPLFSLQLKQLQSLKEQQPT